MTEETPSVAVAENPVTACPSCGSVGSDTLGSVTTDRRYRVDRCQACTLVYTVPRPTTEELQRFYDGTYFRKESARVGGYADYAGMPEANMRLMWTDLRTQAWIRDAAADKRRVLDVGAATGGFLAAAKADGWETLGVEFSSDAIERATTVHGVEVLQGDVFHPALEGRTFDLVTLFHVLEHTIEPGRVLARCAELTAPGGRCLVELPSWASIGRRVRGMRWLQLRPPEHINFFTPRSLATAMRHAGFEIVSATSLYPSLTNRITLKQQRTLSDLAAGAAGFAANAIGIGGYARVIARRPD